MRAGPIVIFHVTEQQVPEVALARFRMVVDVANAGFARSFHQRGDRRSDSDRPIA
jgi:hypothetical protein